MSVSIVRATEGQLWQWEAARLYSSGGTQGAVRLTMQRSSPSLTSLSSLYPFNPPLCLRRQCKNQFIMTLSVQRLYPSLYKRPLCCKNNNPRCTEKRNRVQTQILPLKNKRGKLCVACSDRKAPQCEGRLPSHRYKQGHQLHLHEYAHTVTRTQTQLPWSCVCRRCRVGTGPDHMCSGAGWIWTLKGSRGHVTCSC